MRAGVGPGPPVGPVVQGVFRLVELVAGVAGINMLAFPGSTARYFSWPLGPHPLAGLVGDFYVASAAVFGLGLGRTWREVRGLCVAALVFSSTTIVVTVRHLDTFDFGRWQAWAWVVVFPAVAVTVAVILVQGGASGGGGPRLVPWSRAVLAALAAVLAALALVLWFFLPTAQRASPFSLPPLGGRYAGCWMAFLAVLAAWAALRRHWDEARLSLLALVAFTGAALFAAVRNLTGLTPVARRLGYLSVLTVLLLSSFSVLVLGREVPRPAADDLVQGGP